MTVDLDLINDYLDWRMNQGLAGVKDTPADFAQYRENLERDERVDETLEYLSKTIKAMGDQVEVDASWVYRLLTGTDYEPDDV